MEYFIFWDLGSWVNGNSVKLLSAQILYYPGLGPDSPSCIEPPSFYLKQGLNHKTLLFSRKIKSLFKCFPRCSQSNFWWIPCLRITFMTVLYWHWELKQRRWKDSCCFAAANGPCPFKRRGRRWYICNGEWGWGNGNNGCKCEWEFLSFIRATPPVMYGATRASCSHTSNRWRKIWMTSVGGLRQDRSRSCN